MMKDEGILPNRCLSWILSVLDTVCCFFLHVFYAIDVLGFPEPGKLGMLQRGICDHGQKLGAGMLKKSAL